MAENLHGPLPAKKSDRVIDRATRTSLARTIRRFLDEEISAFAFDKALNEFGRSPDPTVRFAMFAAWGHYDDFVDHKVAVCKQQWDYLQRLLLLLESDRQVAFTSVRRWSWTQLAAVGCLVAFGGCIWEFGWGQHLLVFSIPLGVISIIISRFRLKRVAASYEQVLSPFATFSSLSAAYRSTRTFARKRYPNGLANRRIRSCLADVGFYLQTYAGWLLFSPIPLVVQSFPWTETRTYVEPA